MTPQKNDMSVWTRFFIVNIILVISITYGSAYGVSYRTTYINVIVPDVLGLKLDKARNVIQQHNLTVGDVTKQKTHHPSDSVLVQSPKAQKSVPEKTAIRLVVATPRDKPQTTIAPDLQGLSLDVAIAAIQAANLTLGNVQERKKEIEEAIVLYQSPPAKSQLIIHSKINIIISDPIPLTGPRIKLLMDKKQAAIGEQITFTSTILNPPTGETPRFSFTIDRKAHNTDSAEFTHVFTQVGKHNVIASVRYGRQPWIASLTQAVHIGSQNIENTSATQDKADNTSTLSDKPNNISSNQNVKKSKEHSDTLLHKEGQAAPKPVLSRNSSKEHDAEKLNVELITERKKFNVGESTMLSIRLDKNIPEDELRYAFTINGKAHYTNKPEYTLLLSQPIRYIVSANARHKHAPWVASTSIIMEAGLSRSEQGHKSSSEKHTSLLSPMDKPSTKSAIVNPKTSRAKQQVKTNTQATKQVTAAKVKQSKATLSNSNAEASAVKNTVNSTKKAQTIPLTKKASLKPSETEENQKETRYETVSASTTQAPILQEIFNTQKRHSATTSEQNYIEALLNEADNYQNTDDEEQIAKLATSYYSNASIYRLASQQITTDEPKQTRLTQSDGNTADGQPSPKTASVDSVYLSTSDNVVFTGNNVEFTVTRAINNADSKYYLVFHEEGIVSPVTQSRISHTFSNWGIHSVYAEAETKLGVVKSRMTRVWVWPKWLAIALAIIAALLLLFIYLKKRADSFSFLSRFR